MLPAERINNFVPPAQTIERVTHGHQGEWVDAIITGGKTSALFSYGAPLAEVVLMGNIAIKAYQLKVLKEGKKPTDLEPFDYPGRKTIQWDGYAVKVTNYDLANEWVKWNYREGWELKI